MSAASDAEILQELTRAVSRAISLEFGEGVELAPMAPLRFDRRYSFMFSVRLQGLNAEGLSLLVKIPREAGMKTLQEAVNSEHLRDEACAEYEHMVRIAEVISRAGRPGLSAIRPRGFIREFNALLMDEIPLRMLKTYLTRPAIVVGARQSWRAFETRLSLAGEWLQIIHSSSPVRKAVALKDLGLDSRLEEALKSLEGVLGRPLTKLRRSFRLLCDSLQEEAVPLACLHNDYQLGNIFLTASGGVGALDPNWVEEGPIFKDLSTVLIDPVTRRNQVLFQGATLRRSLQKRFERAVLKGYYGESREVQPVLDFYCALAVLLKWQEEEELLNGFSNKVVAAGAHFLRPWVRGYFHRVALRYLSRGLISIG